MREEVIPSVTRESDMCGSKRGDKMIFSSTYVPFGGKGTMIIGRGKLEVEVLGSEKVGKRRGGFIIQLKGKGGVSVGLKK